MPGGDWPYRHGGDWEPLGCQDVTMRFDRDTVHVGRLAYRALPDYRGSARVCISGLR